MVTKREWLVERGLAKADSRGRFSKEAVAALDQAIDSGVTFDEPELVKPRVSNHAPKAPKPVITQEYDGKAVRAWAAAKGIQVGVRGRIKPEIVAEYLAETADSAGSKAATTAPQTPNAEGRVKVRQQNEAWGYARRREGDPEYIREPVVGFSECGKCSQAISYCKCSNGPFTPAWMGSEPALLDKPSS